MIDTRMDDMLLGTDGDDHIVGHVGADTLVGGLGNDTLSSHHLWGDDVGWRTDVLIGGAGMDTFVLEGNYYTPGSYAVIADWQCGEQVILPAGHTYSTMVEGNSTWILDETGNDVALIAGVNNFTL